jgi:hypothetical protein
MLVKCQECGGQVSDAAVSCPRCAAPANTFLGAERPCAECGTAFRPSFFQCKGCGAPAYVANPPKPLDPEPTVEAVADPAVLEPLEAPLARGSYRPLPGLSLTWNWLRVALLAFMAARTVVFVELLIMGWMFDQAEEQVPGAYERLEQYVALVAQWDLTLVAISIGTFAASAITYMFFVYRGLKHLRGISSPEVTLHPGWGAWGAIVPIATWFVPFMALRQIWRGIMRRTGRPVDPPLTVVLWWFSWLSVTVASAILGSLERAIAANDYDANLWRSALFANLAVSAGFVLAGVFFLSFTRRIVVAWDQANA